MDPISKVRVYFATSVGEADIIVAWLDEQGIRAYVKDRLAAGTLQVPLIVAPLGVEVCVFDPDQAERARTLLSAHQTRERASGEERSGSRSIAVACEECGTVSEFPTSQAGTVQSCPHCREFVDVAET